MVLWNSNAKVGWMTYSAMKASFTSFVLWIMLTCSGLKWYDREKIKTIAFCWNFQLLDSLVYSKPRNYASFWNTALMNTFLFYRRPLLNRLWSTTAGYLLYLSKVWSGQKSGIGWCTSVSSCSAMRGWRVRWYRNTTFCTHWSSASPTW